MATLSQVRVPQFASLGDDLPPRDRRRVQDALRDAATLYADRTHWSGVSLLDHILGVADILQRFSPDADALIAALMHHALDGGLLTPAELERRYGRDVRSIVRGIFMLSRIEVNTRRTSIDNLRLMFLRISSDVRVVLIVLCAKVLTLRHIAAVDADRRASVCRDVLRLYAPVAARLGIYALKHELEGLAFPVAYPNDSEAIAAQLAPIKEKNGQFLDRAASSLVKFLRQHGVRARVEVREKQPYSIFTKMDKKSLSGIRSLYDLFAIRVIVEEETQCYQVLGLLHRVAHPVPNRFKDYIAFPKPNGYQSLHTTLARLPEMPEDMFAEVQIRTERMHRESEYGVAAHWHYKERGSSRTSTAQQLQRLASFQDDLGQGKHASGRDNIFVLTPRGDVFELPEGATPLDFAFHVHTELGISFRSARVNGSIVPMEYQLSNGDIVEIVRQREPRPSARWVQLLRTASARSRLRRYLLTKDRSLSLARGRAVLNAELERHGHAPLDAELSALRVIDGKRAPVSAREEFLARLGMGTLKVAQAIGSIDVLHGEHRHATRVVRVDDAAPRTAVRIEGGVPLPHRFARCCKAETSPGTPIVGVIGRTGDVNIHRRSCRLLKQVNPERSIGVKWVREA